MNKYIGTYRVLSPMDYRTGAITKNEFDTYLSGKYHCECYRLNENKLALYLPSGNSSANIILPQFDELGIEYELHIDGDYEKVYSFKEEDLEKVHSILNFQTKGKGIKPTSVKTARKLNK